MSLIELNVLGREGSSPARFDVARVVCAGYVGRDRAVVQAHIDELAREGIPPPRAVPATYAVSSDGLTTGNRVQVVGDKTSGEAECVVFLRGDEILVGVGSDHTDRELEAESVEKSKQVCAKVVSKDVWRYGEVEKHWDDMILRGYVKPHGSEGETLYQEAKFATILAVPELIELVKSRITDGMCDGLVIFSGTVPIVGGTTLFGDSFRAELVDTTLDRTLTCGYMVEQLNYLGDS